MDIRAGSLSSWRQREALESTFYK